MTHKNAVTRLEGAIREIERLISSPSAEQDASGVQRKLLEGLEGLSTKSAAIRQLILDQAAEIAHLREIATVDGLTGILNRRGFETEMRRLLARAERYGEHGVLIYIDLDGFKPVNDNYGHTAGDAVLRHVATLLQNFVRDSDLVVRLGGDEFAVVLAGAPEAAGKMRATELETILNAAIVDWEGHLIAVRASVGLQAYGAGDHIELLIRHADAKMYGAKRVRAGRQSSPGMARSAGAANAD